MRQRYENAALRRRSDERGATMVEFALAASLLLLTTFAFALLFVWCYWFVASQYIINAGTRLAVTQIIPEHAANPVANVKAHLKNQASKWRITLKDESITVCPYNALDCASSTESIGEAYEFYSVRVDFGSPVNLFPIVVYALGDK